MFDDLYQSDVKAMFFSWRTFFRLKLYSSHRRIPPNPKASDPSISGTKNGSGILLFWVGGFSLKAVSIQRPYHDEDSEPFEST